MPPPPRGAASSARRGDGDSDTAASRAGHAGQAPADGSGEAGGAAERASGEGDRGTEGEDAPWLEHHGLGGQLHPAAIGVWSLQMLGALVLVAIVNREAVVGLLAIAALLLAANAVRWQRFRWRIADDTLIITQGVIQRHRRVIPLQRIQSVDVVRRLSHRVLGVVALNVEAVGGNDTEGQLDALQPRVARQVRAALLAGRDAARQGEAAGDAARAQLAPGAGAETADARPAAARRAAGRPAAGQPDGADDEQAEELARVHTGQLVRAGVTEANVTVLAAAAGFGWNLVSDRIDEYAQRLPVSVGPGPAIVAVLVLLVVAVVLLVLGQLITYWDFRLTCTERDVRIRRGLLEQRFDTIPLRRIQALRIEENVPRRLLGYAAVKADVAGKPGGGSTGTDTLLPFGTAAQARELVATILRDPAATQVPLHPMPRRARRRGRVRAVLVTAAVTAVAVGVWGWLGLLAAAVVIPAVAAADAGYRALGWSRDHGLLVARAGWWTRRTAFVPEHRLQTLARRATVLQRWRRLATVELHIARSPGLWSGPRWIDLDAGDADAHTVQLAEVLPTMAWGGEPTPEPATARTPG